MPDSTRLKATIVVRVKVDNELLPNVMIELSFEKLVETLLHMPTGSLINFTIADNVLLNNTSRHQRFEIAFESKDYALGAQIACLCLLQGIVEPDSPMRMNITIGVVDSGPAYCSLTNPDFVFMAAIDDLSFGAVVENEIGMVLRDQL